MIEQNANTENESGDAAHAEHPKPRYDDVNIPVVTLLGLLSAVLTFVSICFVQGLYYQWEYNMVHKDWNSRILTPQEETIREQREIRDGFFEAGNGKIFVSVDVAARKLLEAEQENHQSPPAGQPADAKGEAPAAKEAPAKTEKRPEPPGPEASPADKADAKK